MLSLIRGAFIDYHFELLNKLLLYIIFKKKPPEFY